MVKPTHELQMGLGTSMFFGGLHVTRCVSIQHFCTWYYKQYFQSFGFCLNSNQLFPQIGLASDYLSVAPRSFSYNNIKIALKLPSPNHSVSYYLLIHINYSQKLYSSTLLNYQVTLYCSSNFLNSTFVYSYPRVSPTYESCFKSKQLYQFFHSHQIPISFF